MEDKSNKKLEDWTLAKVIEFRHVGDSIYGEGEFDNNTCKDITHLVLIMKTSDTCMPVAVSMNGR